MTGRSTDEILVVGGGLAGLALAGYLVRQGREPTVVEQAEEWRASGYGIGLWDDGLAVLDELGCLEAARPTPTGSKSAPPVVRSWPGRRYRPVGHCCSRFTGATSTPRFARPFRRTGSGWEPPRRTSKNGRTA